MRTLIIPFLIICLIINLSLGHDEKFKSNDTDARTCVNVTRINIAVNLLDKECMKEADKNPNFEDENSVEVKEVDMSIYAVCLLKKASIMNYEGRVNVHFDIVKILQNLYKKTDEKGLGLMFVIKALQKCRHFNGNDEYTTAMRIMKCLIDHQETIIRCN